MEPDPNIEDVCTAPVNVRIVTTAVTVSLRMKEENRSLSPAYFRNGKRLEC